MAKKSRRALATTEPDSAARTPNLPPTTVLEKLTPELRTAVVEAASFTGPLPPPSMIEAYERTLAGSADRILKMAEREQDHRIECDQTVLAATRQDVRRSHWLSFSIGLASITGAVVVAVFGNQVVVASILGSSSVVAGVSALVRYFRARDARDERGAPASTPAD